MSETPKIEITPELLKNMRETYGHQCRVCGDRLSLQDSRDLVFACSANEDDPERPGRLRTKPGREGRLDADNNHYERSRRYFTSANLVPRPDVVALIDAYEAMVTPPATETSQMTIDAAIAGLVRLRQRSPLGGATALAVCLAESGVAYAPVARLDLEVDDPTSAVCVFVVEEHEVRR